MDRAAGSVRPGVAGGIGSRWRRPIKFLVVGASGVPVNLGVVFLVTVLLPVSASRNLRDTLSYLAGIAVSIFTNFLLNRAWTWRDRIDRTRRNAFLVDLGKFYVVSSAAAAIQLGVAEALTLWMRGVPALAVTLHGQYRPYHVLAPLAGIAAGFVVNFAGNDLWTFRRRR